MGELKITLERPIRAHGEQAAELTLREPTGADLAACGLPPRSASGAEAGAWQSEMVSRLANIPPSSVEMLGVRDYLKCVTGVAGFFGERKSDPTPPSTDISKQA